MIPLTLLSLSTLLLPVQAQQAPLGAVSNDTPRPLTGRFSHITDFHPDPHYVAGASFDSGCHARGKKLQEGVDEDQDVWEDDADAMVNKGKGKDKGKKETAGPWGSGVSDCDAPMSLVNMTFDWLKKEWADEVDFVVWTGDNARHDIDRKSPRTPKEIFELNAMMVEKMRETFGKQVVIVPSIGNNDIYPHNVLAPGPNAVSSEFLKLWKHFIPEDSRHVFERGVYYSVEVIPDRSAVISLNTSFWYDSNTLVDGCRDRSNDPGALEMDWLEVQLSEFRERGMQVWLTGHVPPHSGSYFENCYLRYGDSASRYQDTIVGHLFGHMNIDHFFFLDVDELEATKISAQNLNASALLETTIAGPELRHGPHLASSGRFKVKGRGFNSNLAETLRKDFGQMPGPQHLKLKDYAVVNVGPSVIPTYLPAIRVFSYNITGVERPVGDSPFETYKRKHGHRHDKPKDDCSKPENEDKPHCVFAKLPRYYNKTSPSRRNSPLTPLGFTQFYSPDVDSRKKTPPEWQVEYATFKPAKLSPNASESGWNQPPPVPFHSSPGWKEEVQVAMQSGDEGMVEAYRRRLKGITPWRMKDSTIGSYVKLARKSVVEKKMWNKFTELMYVSAA